MAISPIPHWFEGSEYTHKVAACIMKYGPISRITLAQILGLSQGAVSRITSDLIYAGVIEETPMAPGQGGRLPKDFVRKNSQKAAQKSGQKENTERRGRPQTGLRIVANARTFVGMKINTTHITAVAVNAIGQIVTGCHDLPLDDDSPESVVDVIKQPDHGLRRRGGHVGPARTVRGRRLIGRTYHGRFGDDVRTVPALVEAGGIFGDDSRRPACRPAFTTISIRWRWTHACSARASD